jgi:hypothetical protein
MCRMTGRSPDHLATRLRNAVDAAIPRLQQLDGAASARRPDGGGWSPRQELGHLVDSAANNHRRVILGRLQHTLSFDGYDGDAWVEAHAYQDRPWSDIITLWAAMNRHLAGAVALVPEADFTRAHHTHTLDVIGFRTYEPGASASLADLVDDYIDHLNHHVEHICGARR